MTDDQFTKLFKYMDDHFAMVDKRLGQTATKDDVEQILTIIDDYPSVGR